MNIRDLFQRPSKTKPPVKKLKATARRAEMVEQSYDDDEQNVRLSRAFLVVMLLHIVAVGGIFAFSSFKKENPATAESDAARNAPAISELETDRRTYVVNSGDTLASIATSFGVSQKDLQTANKFGPEYRVEEGDKLTIPEKSTAQAAPLDVPALHKLTQNPVGPAVLAAVPAVPAAEKTPASSEKKTPPASGTPVASGEFYTVQKGENPVAIAKKLKVKYADLIAINNITDPRKLQIGQKLIVPK